MATTGCTRARSEPDYHPRSKHTDIKYHFTWGLVYAGRITIKYLPTKLVIADTLTKAAPPASIRRTDRIYGSLLGASAMVLQVRGGVGILVTPSSAIQLKYPAEVSAGVSKPRSLTFTFGPSLAQRSLVVCTLSE